MPQPTPTRTQPRDPLRLAILGCAAVVGLICLCMCSLAVAGAVAYRLTYPPAPTKPEAVLDWTDDQVETLRGLDYIRPVSFALMTSADLRRKVEQAADEDWSPEDAADNEIALAALDFLDPASVDLITLMQDLESSQIAGYFDPDEKTLYVISDVEIVNPLDRTTLAHELTHALQDQHFNLERLTDEGAGEGLDSEAHIAFRALVEGDASHGRLRRFLRRHPPARK